MCTAWKSKSISASQLQRKKALKERIIRHSNKTRFGKSKQELLRRVFENNLHKHMYRFASFTLLLGNIHRDKVKDSQYATIIIKLLFIFFQKNKVIFTMQNLQGTRHPLQSTLAKDNNAVHHATTIW